MRTVSLAAGALLAALLFSSTDAQASTAIPKAIAAAVADPARPDVDRQNDADRKPAESLAFAEVKPGQKVISTLDAYPEWQIPSTVRTVIPTADRQKATVKVRVAFDKLDPRILPDRGVKVAFLGDEPQKSTAENAARALVPQTAIRDDGGHKVVFLVKDKKLERRAVTLGNQRGGGSGILDEPRH